jgi:hypothetical protein
MCDTRLRQRGGSGEDFANFLRRHTVQTRNRAPRFNGPTAQRLLGHLGGMVVDPETFEALKRIQELERCEPIEQLLAPAFRSTHDFRDCGAIVLSGVFQSLPLDDFYTDETTGRVVIRVSDIEAREIDPRSPRLWSIEDYELIKNRPSPGSGNRDRIADIATVAIRLSDFSEHPLVPARDMSATLRHFLLMGR